MPRVVTVIVVLPNEGMASRSALQPEQVDDFLVLVLFGQPDLQARILLGLFNSWNTQR